MLAAIKDLTIAIAIMAFLAHSTGQQKWLWKQIMILRRNALLESHEDWGCPSIFSQNACRGQIDSK